MSARPRSKSHRTRHPLAGVFVVVGVLVGAVAVSGCGRDGFEDRTARLTVGEATTTLELDSCGLDGATVFVVGRAPGGVVLQAAVGVGDDRSTGVHASTGLTVDGGGWVSEAPNSAVLAESLGASGPESWARRGQRGRAPGSIASAAVRGARIQVEGRLEPLDPASGRPVAATAAEAQPVSFRLDARCDQTGPG